MKNITRVVSFIAIAILSIGLLRPLAVQAAANTLFLTPSTQTGIQGANFSVAIHEDSGATAINAVQANLDYPASKLKLISVTAASGWTQVQNDTSTSGTILFAAFPTPAGSTLTGDQVLGTVVFQTIGLGSANITFGCNQVPVTCPNGNAITKASDNSDILVSTVGSSITVNSDILASGQTLLAGQQIFSQSGRFELVMQGDGNLVLYGNNLRPLWYSGTSGTGGNRVVMQPDGNLVIYTAANKPVWSSGTDGRGASSLYIQEDGNAVVYNGSMVPTWNSSTSVSTVFTNFGSDRLTSGQTLQKGQYLRSANGHHGLLMQPDGNLVLYGLGYHVLWASYSNSGGGSYVAMQPDGNLVIYTAANKPVWSSGTDGRGSSFAVVQTDGNFVVYASAVPTWNSNTSGKN